MTYQDDLTQSYDIAAIKWRTKIEGLGYAAAYRWMIAACAVQSKEARVIDVGCGAGDFGRALTEVAGPPKSLTLLDPSKQMIAAATRSLLHIVPDLVPLTATLEDAPVQTHDLILCAHVIEHFSDPSSALGLLKALLSPEGKLLLVVSKPHWCNWIIWVRWRHKMIRPDRMHRYFEAIGLSCEWDAPFPAGPPSRSSHAYLVTHQQRTPQ